MPGITTGHAGCSHRDELPRLSQQRPATATDTDTDITTTKSIIMAKKDRSSPPPQRQTATPERPLEATIVRVFSNWGIYP
jgi:hypothetical protein